MIQIDYPCHRHWCPLVCARLTHYLDMAYFDMPVKDHWLIHLWLQGEIPVPWVLSNRDGDQPGINLGPSSKLPQKWNTGRLGSMMSSNQNHALYNGSCELAGCLRSLLQLFWICAGMLWWWYQHQTKSISMKSTPSQVSRVRQVLLYGLLTINRWFTMRNDMNHRYGMDL